MSSVGIFFCITRLVFNANQTAIGKVRIRVGHDIGDGYLWEINWTPVRPSNLYFVSTLLYECLCISSVKFGTMAMTSGTLYFLQRSIFFCGLLLLLLCSFFGEGSYFIIFFKFCIWSRSNTCIVKKLLFKTSSRCRVSWSIKNMHIFYKSCHSRYTNRHLNCY